MFGILSRALGCSPECRPSDPTSRSSLAGERRSGQGKHYTRDQRETNCASKRIGILTVDLSTSASIREFVDRLIKSILQKHIAQPIVVTSPEGYESHGRSDAPVLRHKSFSGSELTLRRRLIQMSWPISVIYQMGEMRTRRPRSIEHCLGAIAVLVMRCTGKADIIFNSSLPYSAVCSISFHATIFSRTTCQRPRLSTRLLRFCTNFRPAPFTGFRAGL
ncbi:hypothetical protein GGS20DRAFT_382386 [Poronia punctata]|nr:hypothetical protein GGS20DRAFT_382386 [Poronia punctata]